MRRMRSKAATRQIYCHFEKTIFLVSSPSAGCKRAKLLSSFIEAVERSCDPHHEQVVAGGIGVYRRNAVRGPYVHVDARGWQAAW
jgi:hypothetical protein